MFGKNITWKQNPFRLRRHKPTGKIKFPDAAIIQNSFIIVTRTGQEHNS
jgi:hypothetical protein